MHQNINEGTIQSSKKIHNCINIFNRFSFYQFIHHIGYEYFLENVRYLLCLGHIQGGHKPFFPSKTLETLKNLGNLRKP